MRLDVPLFRQAKDSSSCGFYCLKMLYHYYGQERGAEEIAAQIERIPNGAYAQELGHHLQRHGFAVALVTPDTTRFPLAYGRLDDGELRAALAGRLATVPPEDKEASYWRGLLRFLDSGGRLVLAGPTIEGTLAPALAAGHPVIVCLDAKALYGRHGIQSQGDGPVDEQSCGQVGHYVVVTGLDADGVTINDPSAVFGGVARYPRDRFLYAWYSYQGYALLATPVRPPISCIL